jgi:ABC-type polysaccharide/polyol phosphate export permease
MNITPIAFPSTMISEKFRFIFGLNPMTGGVVYVLSKESRVAQTAESQII